MPNEELENTILELLKEALQPVVSQLATLATAEARREILSQLGMDRVPTEIVHVPAPALPPKTATISKRGKTQRSTPPHCVFPDCHKPHKGPRFSFMCDDHYDVSKRDKARYLLEWKSKQSG